MTEHKTPKKDASSQAIAGSTSNVAPFAATGRGKPCPICGRPSSVEMRPFCSKRCADIDLGRWLGGQYCVPTSEPASPEDGEIPPSGPPKP
jgi:endogenous inhibitor of DNA gyrase (YacG/DUF329 family)